MNKKEVLYYRVINSPIGSLTLVADQFYLLSLTWGKDTENVQKFYHAQNMSEQKNKTEIFFDKKTHLILNKTELQLKQYFEKKRKSFDIPINPMGTSFQKSAWEELLKIPYGSCISYGEQAKRISKPKAMRAIGAANGKNPIGIIIPCHRVIGANGSLTGFAGGIEMKKTLLEIEGAITSPF